jgi:hypothetical protein
MKMQNTSTIGIEPAPRAALPSPSSLSEQTRTFAVHLTAVVAAPYLEFRRIYYHEDQPSLEPPPPAHAEIRQEQLAQLAERLLRLLPPAVKSVPIVGGLLDHLQHVADLHSISEHERATLHNLTITFLHGIEGGIQPWYVSWLLTTGHNLANAAGSDYFLDFPWHAVHYQTPGELSAFETAVRQGDIVGIERTVERAARRLVGALRDPMGSHSELAFSGPDGEHRRRIFNLRTAAALALGAYLVADEVRALLRRRGDAQTPHSVLASLPPEVAAHLIATGQAAS